jgi:hypothetical protein
VSEHLATSEFGGYKLITICDMLFVEGVYSGLLLPVQLFFRKHKFDMEYSDVECFIQGHFGFGVKYA